MREAALLQGFPANFMFEGPFDDKFKQIGNAVAPIFALELARHVSRVWQGDHIGAAETEDVVEPITKSISSALASMKRRLRLSPAAIDSEAA